MKVIDRVRGVIAGWQSGAPVRPRAAVQDAGGGVTITTSEQLESVLQQLGATAAGVNVTPTTAMRNAVIYRCVTLISGAVANMPIDIKRKVSPGVREDASDDPVAYLLQRRPNDWQTPRQFKQMLTAHVLLRGNAYALKVQSRDRVLALVPMHPDRIRVKQGEDFSVVYVYSRPNGAQVELRQPEVMHLVGLTLDGVAGVSPITYARETIGLADAQQNYGAGMFRNGARFSNIFTTDDELGPEGIANIKASLDLFRQGGENEGRDLILENGMKVEKLSMSSKDAEWIESRKFSQTDLAMFYGVPPHMLGLTEKSTSWGTGIAEQGQGFVTYTLEDYLTAWEETIARDLIPQKRSDLFARFNRAALTRGDIEKRFKAHGLALQWGFKNPDEVRADEDMNPREDGKGGKFYDPPNTAGGKSGDATSEPETPA